MGDEKLLTEALLDNAALKDLLKKTAGAFSATRSRPRCLGRLVWTQRVCRPVGLNRSSLTYISVELQLPPPLFPPCHDWQSPVG